MWNEAKPPRRLGPFEELLATGRRRGDIRWAERTRALTRAARGIYAEGPEKPDAFDLARATMMRDHTPAWGIVAARLLDLDAVHDVAVPAVHRGRGRNEEPGLGVGDVWRGSEH